MNLVGWLGMGGALFWPVSVTCIAPFEVDRRGRFAPVVLLVTVKGDVLGLKTGPKGCGFCYDFGG